MAVLFFFLCWFTPAQAQMLPIGGDLSAEEVREIGEAVVVEDRLEPAWAPEVEASEIQRDALAMRVHEIDLQIEALLQRAVAQVAVYRAAQRAVDSGEAGADTKAEALKIAQQALSQLDALVAAGEPKGAHVAEAKQWSAAVEGTLFATIRLADVQSIVGSWFDEGELRSKLTLNTLLILPALFLILRFRRRRYGLLDRVVVQRLNTSKLVKSYVSGAARWMVIAISILWILRLLGIDISPLLALFGALAVVVGLAIQDRVADVASGILLLGQRPFDEGDWVHLGPIEGMVVDLSLLTTTVRTWDNERITLPNNQVWNNPITNHAGQRVRRISLDFIVDFDTDIEKAKKLLEDLVLSHELVEEEPPPLVRATGLEDRGVKISVKPWVQSTDYFAVRFDVIEQGKAALDAASIRLARPQREIVLRKESLAAQDLA